MKVLILVSCALAAASAGYAPVPYHGPQHYPVIHNGVPVETPEVQHAKHAHLSALAEAEAKAGPYEEPQEHYAEPQQHGGYYNGGHDSQEEHGYSLQHSGPVQQSSYGHGGHRAVAPAYETSHVLPSIDHHGKPLDTPEVEAAKAHHFQAHHEALSRVAHHGPQHATHYRKRRGLYANHYEHIPVIGHNGVPEDTYEVQHARAEHLAAHALASSGGHSYGGLDGGHGYSGGYGSDGGHYSSGLGHGSSGYSIHQNHAPVYGHHDSYSHFVPVIGHDGKPLDTPEVEYAKAKHFQAYHEAAARNSHYGAGHSYGGHQGPIDTPEVQHAKAVHFAAHAAARGHHY